MCLIPKDILLLCQIFGAFPFHYKNNGETKKKLKFSKKISTWNLIVFLLRSVETLIVLLLDCIWFSQGHRGIVMNNIITSLTVSLDRISLTLLALTTLFCSMRKYPHFIKMIDILDDFDQILLRKTHVTKTKWPIICFFIHILFVLSFMFPQPFPFNFKFNMRLLYAPFWSIYWSTAASILAFRHTAYLITNRFKAINEEIKLEIKRQHSWLKKTVLLNRNMIIPDIHRFQARRIHSLISLYWMLCEAVQEANKFYSAQLFMAIFSSFIHITVTFYNLFLKILSKEDMQMTIPQITIQLIWNFTHLIQLVVLVLPSSSVTDAADETAPIICKLMNGELHPEVKKELEVFLLELLHHNARFSAMGFFNVQTHILTSIAGSVTTYLAILIQFNTEE